MASRCTVLFAIDKKDGTINPNQNDNIPGLEALDSADLLILFTRFRNLPDDQMRHIVDYVESGKPIIGLRTATHAFALRVRQLVRPLRLAEQGVGRRVRPPGARRNVDQSPRRPRQAKHARHRRPGHEGPSRSCAASKTATSGARPTSTACACRCPATASRSCSARCSPACTPTIQPLAGREERPDDAHRLDQDATPRPRARRPASSPPRWAPRRISPARACGGCWSTPPTGALGMEDQIPAESNVDIVGQYDPTPFGHSTYKKGVKPADLQ